MTRLRVLHFLAAALAVLTLAALPVVATPPIPGWARLLALVATLAPSLLGAAVLLAARQGRARSAAPEEPEEPEEPEDPALQPVVVDLALLAALARQGPRAARDRRAMEAWAEQQWAEHRARLPQGLRD